MSVIKDSGTMLIYIYKQFIEKGKSSISTKEIIGETKWDSKRINNSFNYLKDLNLIKQSMFIGNTEGVYNFLIMGLTPAGINMIEQEKSFKKNFNLEVNLLLAKFSWGTSEA
jgi:hypothetical protein